MARIHHALLGAAMSLGVGSELIERAEAQDIRSEQSPNPDFPFESLAKSESLDDITQLFDRLQDWAYRENAARTAKNLAKKYPHFFIKHSAQLLNSGVPWAHDALLIALQSDLGDTYLRFSDLDTADPRVIRLLEESMEQRYGEIVDDLWELPEGRVLSEAEEGLLGEAIAVLPTHNPEYFLQVIYSDHEKFAHIIPDVTVREHLVDAAVIHGIVSGNDEALENIVRHAASSEDIRKAIARSYGWEQFLNRCSEQIPGTVLQSLRNGERLFLPLTFRTPRMELYRHAAQRDPQSLISEWPLSTDQKLLLTPADEAEFLDLVGGAYTRIITEDFSHFYQGLLTPEALAQFPQIRRALLLAAKQNPVGLIDKLEESPGYTIPVDVTEYREAAARSILEKRAWVNDSPTDRYTFDDEGRGMRTNESTRNTFEYFAGLPDEDALTEAWFKGSAIDAPATTLKPLFAQSVRPYWFDEALRTDLLYLLDGAPEKLDSFLTYADRPYRSTENDPRERFSFNDLELMLGARAKDAFTKAVDDASIFLLERGSSNPKLAYQLLWILEQSHPCEFAAWVKENTPQAATNGLDAWRNSVTQEQWAGLVAHANSIESSKEYEELAASTVSATFRFNATVMSELMSMNYQHRLKTTIPKEHPLGPIPGENFISIPMLAFETITTSAPFNAYIDAHTNDQLSFVTVCSTAQATWRRLRDLRLEPTPGNIERALRDVNEQWERVRNVEIFGPHTGLITIAHEEARFDKMEFVDQLLLDHGGNIGQVLFQGKGAKDETAILDAIRKRKTTPITIAFHGHGLERGLYLDNRTPIEPTELADALIASGNIGNTRLVLHSCHAYDFVDHLLRYLRKKRIDTTGFIVITSANQGALEFSDADTKPGISSTYLKAVHMQDPGKPITVETFRKAEHVDWIYQDPSITVGLPLSAGWMTGIEVADAQEK